MGIDTKIVTIAFKAEMEEVHAEKALWADKHVVIELYGMLTGVHSRLCETLVVASHDHLYRGAELHDDTRRLTALCLVKWVMGKLENLKIELPSTDGTARGQIGSAPPKAVEFVLEHKYGPKRNCQTNREAGRKDKRSRGEWHGCYYNVDCVMWDVIRNLRERGYLVTAPPAEADPVLALRVAQGCAVVVCSQDGDIGLYPGLLKSTKGTMFYVRQGGKPLLALDYNARVRGLLRFFGVRDAWDAGGNCLSHAGTKAFAAAKRVGTGENELELIRLAAVLFASHDYHGRYLSNGRFDDGNMFKGAEMKMRAIADHLWRALATTDAPDRCT